MTASVAELLGDDLLNGSIGRSAMTASVAEPLGDDLLNGNSFR